MIAIRHDVRPEDYRRAAFLHLRPRPVFGVAGILMLTLVGLVLALKIRSPDPWNISTFMLVGCLVYFAVYFFVVIPRLATKQFKQNRFLAHAAEFRIDETGLHVRSDLGASDIPWDHLHKWKENKRLILLYPTDAMYDHFSRRLFTAEEWEEFRGLAAKNLNKIR